MKKRLIFLISFLQIVFFLYGCAKENTIENVVSNINDSYERNNNLKSAKFDILISTKTENEEFSEDYSGIFIKKDSNSYDWYIKKDNKINVSEILEIDNVTYSKITSDDKEENNWEISNFSSVHLENYIAPLLSFDIDTNAIDDLKVVKDETYFKVYEVHMSQSYLDEIKNQEDEEVKENIISLEESGADQQLMDDLNKDLEERKNSSYSDYIAVFKIDDAQVLKEVTIRYKINRDGLIIENTYIYTIDKYNNVDISLEKPNI